MIPRAYYNDTDPYCAEWLYNLQRAKLIAPGDIDTRPIQDVRPSDLKPYTQHHFFAGLGGWSYALRRAGWSDDRKIWTGSCPCQPFSAAGKGGGFDDERHLWPHFHYLIEQCRPLVVLGEQVASKDGLAWFDLVQSDLEGSGYATGAVDMCSAGFGAPHIRQRLYWMGYANEGRGRRDARTISSAEGKAERSLRRLADSTEPSSPACVVAKPNHAERRTNATGRDERDWQNAGRPQGSSDAEGCGGAGLMADADSQDCGGRGIQRPREGVSPRLGAARERSAGLREVDAGMPSPTNGFWRDADWLFCRDGKWRPVEPGTFPLAHGAASRVGRLRAYGNAINVIQAQAFIEAAMSVLGGAKEQA